MEELDERLRRLRDFEAAHPAPISDLQARNRKRTRRRTGAIAGCCILGFGALWLVQETDEPRGEVAAVDDGRSASPSGRAGTVATPSLVGLHVSEAAAAAERAGLVARVSDRDADMPGAVVIAQEPPAGEEIPPGAIIGLRTALPDTAETQECPGTSHPHDEPATADPLPTADQINRSSADQVVVDHEYRYQGAPLVLGTWERHAYELADDGEAVIVAAEGYQVMALYETAEDCPAEPPSFIDGVPLTRVVLDRSDFGAPGEDGRPDTSWSALPPAPIDLLPNSVVEWTGEEIVVLGGAGSERGAGTDGVVDGYNVEYGPDGEIIQETPMHEVRGVGAAAFDPAAQRWRPLPELPFEPYAIEASTWTGSEIVLLTDEEVGAGDNGPATEKRLLRLDPDGGDWQVREVPDELGVYVWAYADAYTGSEWLLWGYPYHQPEAEPLAVAYEPASDRWREIDAGPLGFRELPGSAWTGDEFIVFGGDAETSYDLADPPPGEGAAYDPSSGTWRELPPAPVPNLRDPAVVWTGSELIVWGGSFGPSNPGQTAAYDPSTNGWRVLADSPVAGRDTAVAVWTGERLVVTDGSPDGGVGTAAYDPRSDRWTVLPAPPGGLACRSAGVGTPFGVFVFGGSVDCSSPDAPRASGLRLVLG